MKTKNKKQSQRRQQVETGVITACECWGGRCEWKQGERQGSVHPAGVKRRHSLLGLHGKGGPDDKEPQRLTLQVSMGLLATSLMMIKQQEAERKKAMEEGRNGREKEERKKGKERRERMKEGRREEERRRKRKKFSILGMHHLFRAAVFSELSERSLICHFSCLSR